MLTRTLSSPRFAFAELLLVVLSGAAWILVPQLGVLFTLIAVLPWVLRLLVGKPAFQRTPLDVLVAILFVTAWVGYWAAYNKTDAWIKAWLIVTAVLLYYALSAQPKQNLGWLSLFSFSLGLAVSVYFFLTFNFAGNPGALAAWWLGHRPQVGWIAIHHGYICGLLVITSLFSLYLLWDLRKNHPGRLTIPLIVLLILGFAVMLVAFLLTVSRGVWMALICGLGVWVIWKITDSKLTSSQPKIRSLFPLFVLAYLCTILIISYLGPAQSAGGPGQSNYGTNSRADVLERGAYFLLDYPITGGGLNSFPGLYSHYMLGIPHFYFINSYNIFLDVAVEQGVIGGLAFLLIYLGAVWLVSWNITVVQSPQVRLLSWIGLFALIFTVIHGLFYDYLYNGNITPMLLFPVGFSMIAVLDTKSSEEKTRSSFIFQTKKSYVPLVFVVIVGMTVLVLNRNKIISVWYSDLGAVKMSQVELKHFPSNEWATSEIVPQLEEAEILLRSSLRYNPDNATANYRLGLISLLRQDFISASTHLETAYRLMPHHRGVIKNLGYDNVWLGKMDEAKKLLVQIPEAQQELNVYAWWWYAQGRNDLSTNSSILVSRLTNN